MPVFIILSLLFTIMTARYIILRKGIKARKTGSKTVYKSDGFYKKLSTLIQIPTISWTDQEKCDESLLLDFQNKVKELYPQVHEVLDFDYPDPYRMILHWKGSNSSEEPVLFMAHYDVVPVEKEQWEKDPFSGGIDKGILWGRGTLDIKSQLPLLLESVETLLQEGFTPQRSLYFAFGGDEEISGARGAQKTAAFFKEQGLRFAMVMDEGGVIAQDMLSFLGGKPAALVGVAEKGFVSYKMQARGDSGHSSMPPKEGTVVEVLSKGISRISKKGQKARLCPEIKAMLEGFIPWVKLPLGFLFANLWLFSPLILSLFSKSKSSDSLIRTSQAFTVIQAGEQENVIPSEASCIVNHRILPGDSMEDILKRHKKLSRSLNLKIEDAGNWPSNNPIVAAKGEERGWNWVKGCLEESHPDVITVPYLVNGSTDSKYFKDLTGQIIRFCPLILRPEDISSIHGINEKVSLENLDRALYFYRQLMQKL